jgi:hypothetical protein
MSGSGKFLRQDSIKRRNNGNVLHHRNSQLTMDHGGIIVKLNNVVYFSTNLLGTDKVNKLIQNERETPVTEI